MNNPAPLITGFIMLAMAGCAPGAEQRSTPAPADPVPQSAPAADAQGQDVPGGAGVGEATRPGPVRGRATGSPSPAPPDLASYFAHARFVPARDAQGQPLGVRIEEMLPGGKVALVGLQVGDIIMAINQVPLNDPRTFDQAVRTAEDMFRAGRPQQVNVIRQGRKMGLIPMGTVPTTPVESRP